MSLVKIHQKFLHKTILL